MDFAAAATTIGGYVTGITAIGAAVFGLHLLIRSFGWGRKVAK